MPIKPGKDETQDKWMGRCVPEMMGQNGGTKRPQEQAVAACMQMWRDKDKEKRAVTKDDFDLWSPDDVDPEPEEDESKSEFMLRCMQELMEEGEPSGDMDSPGMNEDDAETKCEMIWDASADKRLHAVRHKTHAEPVNGMEFVLSDETPDRMGDIIVATGWDLANFQKNPIALFNHRGDFPIGKWRNLHVAGKALRGHLELAPAGTSERIDEIRRLVEAGILKAVSVGFRPIKSEQRKAEGEYLGECFLKSELVETSLVAVPANPNALAVAKSLNISPDTIKLVFAESGKERGRTVRRGFAGESAERRSQNGKSRHMSLAQRIIDAQAYINEQRDKLAEHLKTVDDTNVSDAQLEVTTELNERISRAEKGLHALKEAEQRLAAEGSAKDGNGGGGDGAHEIRLPVRQIAPPGARPFAIPSVKKPEPSDFLWRALTVLIKQGVTRGTRSMAEILKAEYPDDEGTQAVLANIVIRNPGATAPAMTTTAGWAQELVQIMLGEFFKALIPSAIQPRIAARGTSFNFGRAGVINLPMRNTTPTVAGSFVGEGSPIPVRQGQFSTLQLTPKKMAVITTFTREIADHSTPAIEGILRDAILEDTSVALDTVLIDTSAATVIRPAGLLNGITPLTATAGGGFAALIGDLKQLINALTTATRGNFRAPAFVCSPALALSASLTPTTGAQVLPFYDEIRGGTLLGIPLVTSTTVPMGNLILIDCADYASVTGTDVRFEVSDQAVLHMEDTTPLQIGTPGTPATVAAPAQSLWQTDTLALRMIMPMNWAMRRPTSVACVNAVTWQ